MLNRELKPREIDMLRMIRPTSFQDLVEAVRNEIDKSRHNARKELRDLVNMSE